MKDLEFITAKKACKQEINLLKTQNKTIMTLIFTNRLTVGRERLGIGIGSFASRGAAIIPINAQHGMYMRISEHQHLPLIKRKGGS
jgi:hypothetical protein